ncbi:MAG: amidase [Albidovulum sp.]|nr:amidase [Albidovulum sp.]MDE0532726.1 amidase [Albidovulum sp.]
MADAARTWLRKTLKCLERSERHVNAYVHVRETGALEDAKKADEKNPISSIHGWPFAVKEVIEVAGIATSGGCPALADHVPATDATVVARLRDAGAILVGTQVSHELTCGLDEPPTRNPWNLACYPGGSSAGAGVSVAVGSARFALGTDAAGSVRIPAAMTCTTGLKPTAGLVSSAGVLRQASAPSIDNVGIIARTAVDVAQVLRIIAGPDPLDPRTLQSAADLTLDSPPIQSPTIAVLGPKSRSVLNGMRVVESDIDSCFESACELFREIGANFSIIELPELASAIDAVVTFFSCELAAVHRNLFELNRSMYHPSVAEMLKSSFNTPTEQLRDAVRIRENLRSEVDAALGNEGAEFLLTPTTPRVAMELAEFNPEAELGTLIPFTCGFNLTGHPAVSVPCGFSSGGLPIGLQLVGQRCKDSRLLALAQAFQERTDWHEQRPALP